VVGFLLLLGEVIAGLLRVLDHTMETPKAEVSDSRDGNDDHDRHKFPTAGEPDSLAADEPILRTRPRGGQGIAHKGLGVPIWGRKGSIGHTAIGWLRLLARSSSWRILLSKQLAQHVGFHGPGDGGLFDRVPPGTTDRDVSPAVLAGDLVPRPDDL